MRLGHIELFYRDLAATQGFYEAAGFETFDVQGGAFAWMRSGPFEILLRPGNPAGAAATYGATDHGLVLYVEDVPAALVLLVTAGGVLTGDDAGCPTIRDPDGRWLQVVNPADHGG